MYPFVIILYVIVLILFLNLYLYASFFVFKFYFVFNSFFAHSNCNNFLLPLKIDWIILTLYLL